MKLTEKEIEKICGNYKLGKLNSSKLIKQGLQNHNYLIKTDKGKFIIRLLGIELSDIKKETIALEFRVLNFLKENKFPYKIPKPIKNKQGKEISKINNKYYWVYEFIEGKSLQNNKKITNNEIKEIAKALATYHKFIKNLKRKKPKKEKFKEWVDNGFKGIEKKGSQNKIDRLAKENFHYIKLIINKSLKKQCKENTLIIHRDFNKGNLLFENKKLIAIIDFDNVAIMSRISDISEFIYYFCLTEKKFDKKTMDLFLENYEKINKLTKKEKQAIPFHILKNCCALFVYFYSGLKKQKNKKYQYMKEMPNKIKLVIKTFNIKI